MKLPMPAPDWNQLLSDLTQSNPEALGGLLTQDPQDDRYYHWDQLRYRTPPHGWSHEAWWIALKFSRNSQRRHVNLRDKTGRQFSFSMTDTLLRAAEQVALRAGGSVGTAESLLGTGDRNRYIVQSLVEEAISSSQLEGASTSRRVAKELLESGREPADKSELMIYNNYVAMEMIREEQDAELTPEFVLQLHRVLTDGTLEDPNDAGRLETPDHDRVAVWDNDLKLHQPPPAEELPDRLQQLCSFANMKDADGIYIPPVVRAIVVHFMVGYDHYFADGNGRTARALFYWAMLKHGYWLSEYVTISRILKKAPSEYARAYLYTEDDGSDLTYFIHYQLDVFLRALSDLESYVTAKRDEFRSVLDALKVTKDQLNSRQVDLLEHLVQEEAEWSVAEYASKYRISAETARQDLNGLVDLHLLIKFRRSKAHLWRGAPDLAARLTRKN